MNKILLIGFALIITIGLSGCEKATLDKNTKWSEKVLSGEFKEKKVENVEDYKNIEEIDITDTKGEILNGTLRKVIQPGKLWKGYVPISADGVTMNMPVAVRFKADGMIEVFTIGPTEELIRTDDEQFIIEKISYVGDGNVLDDEGNIIANNDKNAKVETDNHISRTIIEFDKALDKNHIMDNGKIILMFTYDYSLLGQFEHSMEITKDGELLLNLNQEATYHLQ